MNELIDRLGILAGVLLTAWSLSQWRGIGFRLEPKYASVGNQDGNFFLMMVLIGIALVANGVAMSTSDNVEQGTPSTTTASPKKRAGDRTT